MDLTQIQFLATNPHRYGDGSFKFEVVLILPSLTGGVTEIVGTAQVHVNTDKACQSLGRALVQIGEQLPPEIVRPS